eukprot:9780668-Ditylum_brightwellii.AAC.1
MSSLFETEELGELEEYVGCKIEYNREERWMRLTQPILLQSYEDEFELDEHGLNPHTPADTGSMLERIEGEPTLGKEEHGKYRMGVGKLLHMSRWIRPEIQNAVRKCSKMNSFP